MRLRRPLPLGLAALALIMGLAGPSPAAARGSGPAAALPATTTLVALMAGNRLLVFRAAHPGALERTVTLAGLPAGISLASIDFRPATAQLYGLGIANTFDNDTGWLYRLDLEGGLATRVGGAPFSTVLADGASYGFDFDPINDWIRVVNDDDVNLRVNPATGALRGDDTRLDNPVDTEQVVGAAYDRSFAGATAATLFGIDYANDLLVRQGGVNGEPPAWSGQITTIGSLGVTTEPNHVGFDIADDGTAYASLRNIRFQGAPYGLYQVSLSTGAATFLGAIGDGAADIQGLAVFPTRRLYLPWVSLLRGASHHFRQ